MIPNWVWLFFFFQCTRLIKKKTHFQTLSCFHKFTYASLITNVIATTKQILRAFFFSFSLYYSHVIFVFFSLSFRFWNTCVADVFFRTSTNIVYIHRIVFFFFFGPIRKSIVIILVSILSLKARWLFQLFFWFLRLLFV